MKFTMTDSFALLVSGLAFVVAISIPLKNENSLTAESLASAKPTVSVSHSRYDRNSAKLSQQDSKESENEEGRDFSQLTNPSKNKILKNLQDLIRKNTKSVSGEKKDQRVSKSDAGNRKENETQFQSVTTLEQKLDNFVAAFNAEPIVEPTPEDIQISPRASTAAPNSYEGMTSCIFVKGIENDRWIQAVSLCPPEWNNQTIRQLCEWAVAQNGHLLELPVQNDQGVVYANRFCAACHGETKLLEWKVGWTCEDAQLLAVSLLGYFSGGSIPESFLPMLEEDKSCKMAVTPYIARGVEPCQSPSFRHSPRVFINPPAEPTTNYPVSFNVLMNFDFAGKTHILFMAQYDDEDQEGPRCGPDEAYDPIENQCRETFCGVGQRWSTGGCVPDERVSASSPVTSEVPADLSQLGDSRAPQHVHLEVTIPASEILLFNISGYQQFLQEQIASQLNISVSRIVNFQVTLQHGSPTHPVEVHTMTKDECVREQVDCDGDPNPSNLTAGPEVVTSSIPFSTTGVIQELVSSSEEQGNDNSRIIDEDHSNKNITNTTTGSTTTTSTTTTTTTTTTTNNNKTIATAASSEDYVVTFSFVLQPSRSGEQRSLDVVESMSVLVKDQRLHLTINGTSLLVVKVGNNDSGNDTAPPCPYGRTRLENGAMLVLQRYNSERRSNETVLYVNDTGATYPTGKFELTVGIEGNSRSMNFSEAIRFAIVCDMPHISASGCLRIQLERSEYEWDPREKSLRFQNHSYNSSSFEVVNEHTGRVEICVPDTYDKPTAAEKSRKFSSCYVNYENLLKAEGYMTAVLGRVSIVALASVLITYCLFPRLRNLPGVNIMNLTTALFVAEIIFITGQDTQTRWLCSAVAAALHYFFLASHCWMNVMSYDVFRTFASGACILTRIRDKTKYLPRYALYAWGMPLLVIGACALIDFSHVLPGISIGYGGVWSDTPSPGSPSALTRHDMAARAGNGSGTHRGNGSGCGDGLLERWGADAEWKRRDRKREQPHADNETRRHDADNDTRWRDADNDTRRHDADNDTSSDAPFSMVGRSCWIQQPLAALLAFGAPILLIFLANCFLFARTILSIRCTAQLAKVSTRRSSVRHLSGRNDVILYVKMATVMGFTWIFGLASSIVSAVADEPSSQVCMVVHVLGILFPIMNCSQGLFIFFVFVFNRRVLKLYEEKAVELRKALLAKKQSKQVDRPSKARTNIAYVYKE